MCDCLEREWRGRWPRWSSFPEDKDGMSRTKEAAAKCRTDASYTTGPSVPQQTDRKTWLDLRWGMGPGDVEAVLQVGVREMEPLSLRRLPAFSRVHQDDGDRRYIELPGRLKIAARDCSVRLGFHRGRLYVVTVTAAFDVPSVNDKQAVERVKRQRVEWRDLAILYLRGKHGAPYEDLGDVVRWRIGPTSITLDALDFNDGRAIREDVDFYYYDTAAQARIEVSESSKRGKR